MFKTLLIAGLAVGSASPVSAQADRPADATWPVHRIERARKPWTAQGRVTDAEGRPLAGVSVHASCGMGSLHNTGSCVSDRDGRYELSFGPGIWFAGDDHSGLQAAIISARSAGLFEENLNRQGGCVAASRRPSDEELKAYAASRDRCFVPGEPLTIDFVMRPAAKFSGRLVDERDQPLAGWSVSLTGAELPPASSVLASAKADDDGRFVIEQIPTTVRFQVEVRRINPKPPWDDTWASAALTFERPDSGDLRAKFGRRELQIEQLTVQVRGAGVHGRMAVAVAGNRGQLNLVAPDGSLVEVNNNRRLKAGAALLALSNSVQPESPLSLVPEEVPASPARPLETKLVRTRSAADGSVTFTFENPSGWVLAPEKHQVIFQVFVGVSHKPVTDRILKQLPVSPDGRYQVSVKIPPTDLDDSRVSITFVSIQPDHDAWVTAFFKEGRGTKYSGLWKSDGGLMPVIPLASSSTP